MKFLKVLSCFAVICSVIVMSDIVQARSLPDNGQIEEKELYKQAEKYFKTIRDPRDVSHFLTYSSRNKIVEKIVELAELLVGAEFDSSKTMIDALSDVAKIDSLPGRYFKKTRKLIKEKLSKIQPFISAPNKKEEVLEKLRGKITTCLHYIEKFTSMGVKETQENALQEFKKLLEQVMKNIDHSEEELKNLDTFIAKHLDETFIPVENRIKKYEEKGYFFLSPVSVNSSYL